MDHELKRYAEGTRYDSVAEALSDLPAVLERFLAAHAPQSVQITVDLYRVERSPEDSFYFTAIDFFE